MSHILHRLPLADMPVAVRGNGVHLYDSDHNEYLDASGGAAVLSLGHSHPAVTDAIERQLSTLPYVHSGFFTTEAAEELAETLARLAPGDLAYSVIVSSGSEAIEAALKLARQYCCETGQSGKTRFIARRRSFHGSTLATLSVAEHVHRRQIYEPLLMPAYFISPYYPYRFRGEDEPASAYSNRTADELEQKIAELGAENVIAFLAETVGGATAGVLPPSREYLQRVRQICDEHGILLILDEVMCGMGRTGEFFACDNYGVQPDIITFAKGLGSGHQSVGAMMCTADIQSAIRGGSRVYKHGNTYMGHATSCAAANAVLNTIASENLLDNVKQRGADLLQRLHESLGDHPNVGEIRGIGLFIGIEFVKDRESKEPFPEELNFSQTLKRSLMNNFLIAYPGSGTIDGYRGDHLIVAPPFIIDDSHVDEIVARLTRSVADAAAAA